MDKQKSLNEKFENKDIRIARQSSIKASVSFLETCANVGVFKPKNEQEAFETLNAYRNKIFDWIYKDMELHETPKQHEQYTHDGDTGHTRRKPMSDKTCDLCGRQLTKGEEKFCQDQGLPYECYRCRKG